VGAQYVKKIMKKSILAISLFLSVSITARYPHLKRIPIRYFLQIPKSRAKKNPVLEDLRRLSQMLSPIKKRISQFNNTAVPIDHDHILGIDVLFWRNQFLTFSGFHHDYRNRIAKSGIISILNRKENNHGVVKIDMVFHQNKMTKTFFPPWWTHDEVIKNIQYVYNNYTVRLNKSNGNYMLQGTTPCGITIKMHCTKEGKIKTAFPVLSI